MPQMVHCVYVCSPLVSHHIGTHSSWRCGLIPLITKSFKLWMVCSYTPLCVVIDDKKFHIGDDIQVFLSVL